VTVDVDAFVAARPRLFGIAYRMLGRVSEADDVVGDVAERWLQTDAATVTNPEAWLVTVTTRRALDIARSARLSRVDYHGEWLPEPWPTRVDADPVERRETLTMSFLLVLERLTPVERAVFVLRDVLDEPYPVIAEAIGRSEPACRQILHRARHHVQMPAPRLPADRAQAEAVAAQFLAVTAGQDLDQLLAVLAPNVVVTSDGGGVVHAAVHPVVGAGRASRFLLNLARRTDPAAPIEVVELNGEPGVLLCGAGRWVAIVVEVGPTALVDHVRIVANPDKLQPLLATLGLTTAP
jgi:RNA polymerase sigma-70 factor (ECF subfamily)